MSLDDRDWYREEIRRRTRRSSSYSPAETWGEAKLLRSVFRVRTLERVALALTSAGLLVCLGSTYGEALHRLLTSLPLH